MTKDDFVNKYLRGDSALAQAGLQRLAGNDKARSQLVAYAEQFREELDPAVAALLFPQAASVTVEPAEPEAAPESVAKSVDLLAFMVSPRQRERMQKALELVDTGFKDGYIIQARYKELRDALNRTCEDDFSAVKDILYKTYFDADGNRARQPSEVEADVQYTSAGLSTLNSLTKRVAALPEGLYKAAAQAYLARWKPIAEKVGTLKTMIGKAPAKAEKVQPENELSRALDKALADYKPEIEKDLIRMFDRWVVGFLERWGNDLSGIEALRKNAKVGSSNWEDARQANATWSELLWRLVDTVPPVKMTAGHETVYKPSPTKIAAHSAEVATDICKQWKFKIMDKLVSMDECKIHYLNGSSFRLSGKVHGHAIRINQQRIMKSSSLGKLFNQFPSHIYVDGKFKSEAEYKAWYKQQAGAQTE